MYTEKNEHKFRIVPRRIPVVRFAIVGNPRTGSSHLVSLLDSHPDIACWDDEPFMPGEAFDKSGYQKPAEFLVNSVFDINAHAVGFKLLWDAMQRLHDPWQLFDELGIALVHVRRQNLLDAYISLQLVLEQGIYEP